MRNYEHRSAAGFLSPQRRLTARLLRAGIITPIEAARQLTVDRQTVYYWARDIDHQLARQRRVDLIYRTLLATPWALTPATDDIPGFEDLTSPTWQAPARSIVTAVTPDGTEWQAGSQK